MKKLLAVGIAAIMLSAPVFAGEADFSGEWYGDLSGAVIKITMNEDGTYLLDGLGEEQEGTWEATDEGILVDGESTGILSEDGLEITYPGDMTIVYGRDPIAAFVPAEIDYEAELDALQGKWTACKVGSDGTYLDVASGDTYYMEMEITDTTARMNGFYFEDETFELEQQDGGLSRFTDDESEMFEIIAVNVLEDGMLRLALVMSVEDNEEIEYFFIPAEDAEAATETAAE